ncbi:MAG: DUF2804 domain-containing protein [Pseudomonadota bacterium]|nr:DUF2804 domain-containing protein [Pseudomonadota bacterium]
MAAREQLINAQGQPAFGIFPDGVEELNYLDYDLRSPMDRRRSKLARRLAFNQFQFISLISPELIVGIAIVDLKLVSNAFVYFYEPHSGRYEEFSFLQPLALKTRIDAKANNGSSVFSKGRNHFSIHASTTPGVRRVQVSLAAGASIDATIDETTAYQPLALCTRAGYQGWVFTQKSAAQVCNGSIRWQQREYDLKAMNTLAAVDWSGGYMRRETFWNWGSLSCFLRDGRRLGFNLAAGVNETGYSENALWLDGRLIKVDMVDFQFDRYHPSHSWAMRSADGIIDLHFEPQGRRREKINALVIASNFSQYYGRYHGEIHLPGETIRLEGEWGLAEDHYARW